MVLVPILLMPLLTIGCRNHFDFAVWQGHAGNSHGDGARGRRFAQGSGRCCARLKDIAIVPARSDYAQEISNKEIRAAVEIPPGFDAAVERGEIPTVRIYMYEGELRSSFAADRLQRFFRDLRDRVVTERLAARQLPANLTEPFRIEQQNVASPEKVSGTIIGGLVPYFIIVMCLAGATYPAIDLTAGEKERGTIETILSSPVSRVHLVLGKFFMVLTAALFTAALSMASMGLTFAAGKSMLAGMRQSADFDFAAGINVKALLAVFVMVIPLAVLFSAALLAIALFAKSYREAQSYLFPADDRGDDAAAAIVSVLPGVRS